MCIFLEVTDMDTGLLKKVTIQVTIYFTIYYKPISHTLL